MCHVKEVEKEPLGNQYIIHNGDTLETGNIRYTLPNFELTLTAGRGSQLGGKPASKHFGCPNGCCSFTDLHSNFLPLYSDK